MQELPSLQSESLEQAMLEQPELSVHDRDKAAPPQVASPPQEAPLQVRVWVPVPQVLEQELQPDKVASTGVIVPLQAPQTPVMASQVEDCPQVQPSLPEQEVEQGVVSQVSLVAGFVPKQSESGSVLPSWSSQVTVLVA